MEQNKELPKRKTPRLQNFDYNIEGAYFITICTQNRKNILSSIVGEGRNSQSHTIISAIAWLKFQATKEIKQIYGDSHEKFFSVLFMII